MKKIYYIFLIVLSGIVFTSCEENTDDVYQIDQDQVMAVFDSYRDGLGGLADGTEYAYQIKVKITGPGIENLTSDVEVTVAADESSTALEGKHYRIENKTITLTKKNSYLGLIDFVLVTEGNTPPLDDAPEFETYEAPVLKLKIASATASVMPTGKASVITLNYTPPNPYAGEYDTHVQYFHPTAGGTYPTEPYSDDYFSKTLEAVTGRQCVTLFAIESWTIAYADKCWIKVKPDNSVDFEVADTWSYDVINGDPYDASLVSHYDPETRVIYLYYHYNGAGGPRIFWEVLTPKFK